MTIQNLEDLGVGSRRENSSIGFIESKPFKTILTLSANNP
jgi:hypothetical protein